MDKNRIFIGDIMICTKYEPEQIYKDNVLPVFRLNKSEEIYKEKAILLKTNSGGYIDLDLVWNIFDQIKMGLYSKKTGLRDNIMSTIPLKKDALFVRGMEPMKLEKNLSFSELKLERRKQLTTERGCK